MQFSTYLVLLVGLSLVAAGCSGMQAQAGSPLSATPADGSGGSISRSSSGAESQTQSNLDGPIVAVFPAEGSQACPRPQIGARLVPNDAMLPNGSFDPSSVSLVVDGADVTAQASVLQTASYPTNGVQITYVPGSDLALGEHQAAITYPGPSGPSTYQWSFTVAAVPCQ